MTAPPAYTSVRGYPYPRELQALHHFEETSWGNDVTDSVVFSSGVAAFLVWIDAAAPSERTQEWGWDPSRAISDSNACPARFTLCRLEPADDVVATVESRIVGDVLLETDDVERLLAAIRSL